MVFVKDGYTPPLITEPAGFLGSLVSLVIGSKSDVVDVVIMLFTVPLVCVMEGALTGLALSFMATAVNGWRASSKE